jgi:hypothetical protein
VKRRRREAKSSQPSDAGSQPAVQQSESQERLDHPVQQSAGCDDDHGDDMEDDVLRQDMDVKDSKQQSVLSHPMLSNERAVPAEGSDLRKFIVWIEGQKLLRAVQTSAKEHLLMFPAAFEDLQVARTFLPGPTFVCPALVSCTISDEEFRRVRHSSHW